MNASSKDELLRRLENDPWSLSVAERECALDLNAACNERWRARLVRLVEPPLPDASFPAFLLETARFADLGRAVARARRRVDLGTATADELQRFVDLFRAWVPRSQVGATTSPPLTR